MSTDVTSPPYCWTNGRWVHYAKGRHSFETLCGYPLTNMRRTSADRNPYPCVRCLHYWAQFVGEVEMVQRRELGQLDQAEWERRPK